MECLIMNKLHTQIYCSVQSYKCVENVSLHLPVSLHPKNVLSLSLWTQVLSVVCNVGNPPSVTIIAQRLRHVEENESAMLIVKWWWGIYSKSGSPSHVEDPIITTSLHHIIHQMSPSKLISTALLSQQYICVFVYLLLNKHDRTEFTSSFTAESKSLG